MRKTKTIMRKNTSNLLVFTSMLSSGKIGKSNCWESVSLSEKKALNLYERNRQQLLDHGRNSWMRIYPQGTRFDSSNYNPLPMLEVGAQIVALNTQSKSV